MILAAIYLLIGLGVASAHNLNQRADYIGFDPETLARMQQRQAAGQPLIQAGDVVGLIMKATPSVGTPTGAGGYSTFFVPVGSQVVGAQYGRIDLSGKFVAMPMKGQSILALGDGSVGAKAQNALKGLELGPNILGDKAYAVDSTSGLMRGTMAGVYSDTGIFYSTDPKTAWQSWVNMGGYDGSTGTVTDNLITNNSGDRIIPTTRWDAEQLLAFGSSSPIAPLVDSADGRGNTPWGTGSVVAGPQSGYAWSFNKTYWDANASDPARMKNAIRNVGPWQRIKYPGSMVAKDTPGLRSTALGYVGVDGSNLGYALSAANPLPPTTSWSDATSPKAVRLAWGNLELFRPEYARLQLKINVGPGLPNSPFDAAGYLQSYADTFGGDAGGEYTNKDHLWRYYEPTTVSLVSKPMIFKQASKPLVAPNEVFTYTIWYTTFGNTALTNVVIDDTLPSGITYISATPAPSSTSPLRWNVGTVPANSVRSITLTVRATGTGVKTNTVCATSDQAAKSCSTDTIEVSQASLLYPDKTVTPSTANPGDLVTYTLSLINEGPCPNPVPLVIRELLSPGFTYDSLVSAKLAGSPTSAITVNSSNPAQPIFTVNSSIDNGKSLVIVFKARISAAQAAGIYTNSYTFEYSGKVMSTGALAPVTVGGGRIGDLVFRDWNSNGLMGAEDEPLPGVQVQLFASNGATLLNTKTTDAQGKYDFTSLSGGTYVVKVTAPAAHTATYDLDGIGTLNQTTVTISEGEKKLNVEFGSRPGGTGSVSGTVFNDLGNDGTLQAGDPGLPNITVRLYRDLDSDGVIDAGTDALIATLPSGAGGAFSFTNLPLALDYLVDVDQVDADIATGLGGSPFSLTTSDPHRVQALTGAYIKAHFGFWRAQPASIGDAAFIDADADGIFDSGETPVANLPITLFADTDADGQPDSNELLSSARTDTGGLYRFNNVGAGTYIVVCDLGADQVPAGYTVPNGAILITVTAGQTSLTNDFPFTPLLFKSVNLSTAVPGNTLTYTVTPNYRGSALLTGVSVIDTIPTGTTYVASSANAGGTLASGKVTWNIGSSQAGVPSTGSGPGSSSLTNSTSTSRTMVGPGTQFTVSQTLTSSISVTGVAPAAPVLTVTNGVGATLVSGPNPASATVGPTGTTFTWIYQATAGSSIGQVKFGISATNGTSTWTSAITNSVIVLPNLTFQVTVNGVPGVESISNVASIQSAEPSGTLTIPAKNSNTVQTTLAGSIGDTIYADNNANGVQDAGEPGVAGIKVIVTNGSGTTKQATTDSSGIYRVHGLNANSGNPWTINVDLLTLPTDWVMTTTPTLTRTLATSSTQISDADFGVFKPADNTTAAEIRGIVWTDRDEDGLVEDGEARLQGIAVNL
ncbi:MAG: SdrD B-like domain-containing protein, partial [Prosthecobacter sp.]